jgi:hypothetical protein
LMAYHWRYRGKRRRNAFCIRNNYFEMERAAMRGCVAAFCFHGIEVELR